MSQQFIADNRFLCELEQDLIYTKQWEEKEKKGEIDEIDLKKFLDVMVWKTVGVINWIKTLNLLAKYNIEGFEREYNVERTEEDVKLEESI